MPEQPSQLPLRPHRWGPLDALYSAVRRRLPQVLVSHVRAAPQPYVRVTYRGAGPADVAYIADIGEYRWTAGGDPDARLGGPDDLGQVLRAIAEHLGAALLGPSPTDCPTRQGDR